MRILALSRYEHLGASSRYRIYQYIPFLEKTGSSVTVLPLMSDSYLRQLYAGKPLPAGDVFGGYIRRLHALLLVRRFDVIWLQQEAFPWMPAALESLLFPSRVPVVVDYDDAFFHRYDLHQTPVVRWLLSSKIDSVMRRAAIVVAGNAYLADRARKSGARRVEILPTVVDIHRYPVTPQPRHDVFTIGWIGSRTTSVYLSSIRQAIAQACVDGSARLRMVGAEPAEPLDIPVEVRPWSEATEVEELMDFDVGIMPLVDSPWERGKCGFKLIQYMACARPAVGSPVGMNREIITHGTDGFLASTTEEWTQAFRILQAEPQLRQEMGTHGRRKVETKYDISVTGPLMVALFQSLPA